MSAARHLDPSTQPPACLPGFDDIAHYFDRHRNAWVARVLPGEYYVTAGEELIATVLGSCVAACIRDTRLGIGGMNHFMLATPGAAPSAAWADKATRYGLHAMEKLINGILRIGGNKVRLEVKIFGGGRILNEVRDIGGNNVRFVREFLAQEGLNVASEDVLGRRGRRLIYSPSNGKAFVKPLPHVPNDAVAKRDRKYSEQLREAPTGAIELF